MTVTLGAELTPPSIDAGAAAKRSPSLGGRTKLFYALGAIAFGVKDNGFGVFLLLYYNQVLGLPASLAGTALVLALFVDAFFDPLIGHLSDNLLSRWGRSASRSCTPPPSRSPSPMRCSGARRP